MKSIKQLYDEWKAADVHDAVDSSDDYYWRGARSFRDFIQNNQCSCQEYPHVILLNPGAHSIRFPQTDLGEIAIGPLQPGQEEKAQINGHWYLVRRAT